MTTFAAKAGLLSALTLTLAACSSTGGNTVDPNIYPTQYKQEIVATLRSLLSDPTHVQGAMLSPPALTQLNKEQRYYACLRFSERNPDTKQYDPPQTRIAYFYAGHLNQLVAAKEDQCVGAAYQPFPEGEKLCPNKSDCR